VLVVVPASGDAAEPVALEPVPERLGLADTLVAAAPDVLDQPADALEDLAVLDLPPDNRLHNFRTGEHATTEFSQAVA
jgi:hypothetical protein